MWFKSIRHRGLNNLRNYREAHASRSPATASGTRKCAGKVLGSYLIREANSSFNDGLGRPRGLDYLVEEQAPDGSIVGSQNPSSEQINAGANFQQYFMFEHAIATFAVCEACAMAVAEGQTPDRRYLGAARRAVQFIEHWQHNDGGWRYTRMPTEQSDCSVSGWMMLALKTAREAQIQVPQVTILVRR
jgi:hypothetical protein